MSRLCLTIPGWQTCRERPDGFLPGPPELDPQLREALSAMMHRPLGSLRAVQFKTRRQAERNGARR